MLSRIGRSSGQQIGVTGVTASRSSWGIEALDSFGCIQNTPRCGDAPINKFTSSRRQTLSERFHSQQPLR